MEKKVMVLANSHALVCKEEEYAARFAALDKNAVVLDITRTDENFNVEVAMLYAKHYETARMSFTHETGSFDERVRGAIAAFKHDFADWVVDTSDAEWWYNQVGR